MKFSCDRLDWKKWPHLKALRPLDGAWTGPFASSEARLLIDIDASFNNFYKPTGDACWRVLTSLKSVCKKKLKIFIEVLKNEKLKTELLFKCIIRLKTISVSDAWYMSELESNTIWTATRTRLLTDIELQCRTETYPVRIAIQLSCFF
jgi:hypothetical protein